MPHPPANPKGLASKPLVTGNAFLHPRNECCAAPAVCSTPEWGLQKLNKIALIASLAALMALGAASRAQEAPGEEPTVEEGNTTEVAAEEVAAEAEPFDAVALPTATVGALTLQLSMGAGLAYFTQNNCWYGRSTANLGRNSDRWAEVYLSPGLTAEYDLAENGRISGGVSAVGCLHPRHRRSRHQRGPEHACRRGARPSMAGLELGLVVRRSAGRGRDRFVFRPPGFRFGLWLPYLGRGHQRR